MYLVPMKTPQFCNECPFGYCNYSHPFGSSLSEIDGAINKSGTYGYVCNIDFSEHSKYTKIMRADIDEDIRKPIWCKLKDVNENDVHREEVMEPVFSTTYPEWIIAFCPDTDSFFCTNQRFFFWESEESFSNEADAIQYFQENREKFVGIHNDIAKECGGISKNNRVFLENTKQWY